MALWDRVFYEKPFGETIMETILTPATLNSSERTDYAFGLVLKEYRGLKTIEHGGSFVDFRADMMRFPAQKFSVVCLMNTARGDPARICRGVADIFLAGQLGKEEEPEKKEDVISPAGDSITAPAIAHR